MTFYRDKDGIVCEAAQFKGGHLDDDYGLCFKYDGDDSPQWLADAMNDGTLELSAFGSALVLNFRGGSYGLAVGDWVIRRRGGEIVQCHRDKFAEQYQVVA